MAIQKDDLLSIKKFSQLTGIKQSTLRYYDDLGLFTPAARGENGYRYYSPVQIITINSIALLHQLDMPIRQISEIQNNRSPETLLEVLNAKEATLEAEYINIERSYSVVKTLKRLIQQGLAADENIIETVYLDDMQIVIGPINDFKKSPYFYDAFTHLCSVAKQYRIDLRLPVGGYFTDFNAWCEEPGRPAHFFSVDPKGLDKREAGKYLVAYQRAYYGETGDLTDRVKNYLDDNDRMTIGPLYTIFVHDELSIDDPENYLMQVTIEVAPAR